MIGSGQIPNIIMKADAMYIGIGNCSGASFTFSTFFEVGANKILIILR